MTARRLDGKATAAAIRAAVKHSSEKCSVSRCHVAERAARSM
ncbi:MAG TPA: hypothetical protein VES21_05195 [Nocardioidaceae bacterium]|nr:hypothetical protein [Nocardioidaceae bacterium]